MRNLAIAASLATISLLAIACRNEAPAPAPQPAAAPDKMFSPLVYFGENCAHCHGTRGEQYSRQFSDLSDVELRETVVRMSEGFANAPISGTDLTAVVALHRSMIRREPFLAVTSRSERSFSGEATGAQRIEAAVGETAVEVEMKGSLWSLNLPSELNAADLIITAHGEGETSAMLRPAQEAHTHTAPL